MISSVDVRSIYPENPAGAITESADVDQPDRPSGSNTLVSSRRLGPGWALNSSCVASISTDQCPVLDPARSWTGWVDSDRSDDRIAKPVCCLAVTLHGHGDHWRDRNQSTLVVHPKAGGVKDGPERGGLPEFEPVGNLTGGMQDAVDDSVNPIAIQFPGGAGKPRSTRNIRNGEIWFRQPGARPCSAFVAYSIPGQRPTSPTSSKPDVRCVVRLSMPEL